MGSWGGISEGFHGDLICLIVMNGISCFGVWSLESDFKRIPYETPLIPATTYKLGLVSWFPGVAEIGPLDA